MNKKQKLERRYWLWALSLIAALALFISIACLAMMPAKYLCLIAVLGVAVYAGLFFLQRRWSKGRGVTAVICEVFLTALCIYGMSVLYHAAHMVNEITESVTETETVSVYVMQDAPLKSLTEAVNEPMGVVKGQSEEAVAKVLERLQDETGVSPDITEFADMFLAADALRSGEVKLLLMNEAYAGLIPEIEGYEWFAQDVKTLEVFEEEVRVVLVTELPIEDESLEEPVEAQTDEQAQSPQDIEDAFDEEQADGLKPEAEQQITMELMGPAEQVDWNALVNQELLEAPDGAFIMYISGVDTWGSVAAKSRSDVNILAVVNTNTKKILLVSTPRDYYVPLSVSKGVKDKLTHAGIYGINCSQRTLEMLYGVDIQYYVRMNFTGFVNIVDAVGGIDVYSDEAFTVGDAFTFDQGMNHMSGIEALAFARERYGVAGGDVARGNHQMEVIKAVLNKCTSASVLYNYADVMNNMSGCFSTDMSKDKIASLVRMQLGDMAQWSITSMSVSGSGAHKTTYSIPGKSVYVMVPDEASVNNAKNSIATVLNGQ